MPRTVPYLNHWVVFLSKITAETRTSFTANSGSWTDGPWGIGVRRPKGQPDLPGQTSGEPLSNSEYVPVDNPIREEVRGHLEQNNGEFNWVPSFAPEARREATSQSLYWHPENWAGARPLPACLPQKGAPQFRARLTPTPRETSDLDEANTVLTPEPDSLLQHVVGGSVGLTRAAKAQFYDDPHHPPATDPNLPSVGDHPPTIFRFKDARGEGFDPLIMLQNGDLMDIDVSLNKATKTPASDEGTYAGGVDFQGALARRIGQELKFTTRTQAPNTILTLGHINAQASGVESAIGAGRIPTSPLPLSGPRFPANKNRLPPFETEAWNLDLLPASSFDEVAGLTVPKDSIRMVDPEAGSDDTKYCEELLDDDSRCLKVALAQCVDRYVLLKVSHRHKWLGSFNSYDIFIRGPHCVSNHQLIIVQVPF